MSDKLKNLIELRKRKWDLEKVALERKIKDECNCFLQENQNLEISRIKRSKASKRYQKCRKSRSKSKSKKNISLCFEI